MTVEGLDELPGPELRSAIAVQNAPVDVVASGHGDRDAVRSAIPASVPLPVRASRRRLPPPPGCGARTGARLSAAPEFNTTGLRADWRLADGTFVEALGLMTKEAYAAKVTRKRELARHHGLRLVTVTAEDLNRLSEIFADWLPKSSAG